MSTYVPSGVAGGPTATEGPGGLPPLQSFSNFPIVSTAGHKVMSAKTEAVRLTSDAIRE